MKSDYQFGYRKTDCNCDTPDDCTCNEKRAEEKKDQEEARRSYLGINKTDDQLLDYLNVINIIKEKNAQRGK